MHIAVAVPYLLGRLHSTFELISRLEKEGHSVTCLCSKLISEKIENQGFSFVEIPEINFYYQDSQREELTTWFLKCKYYFKNLNRHYAYGKRILNLDEYKSIIIKLT